MAKWWVGVAAVAIGLGGLAPVRAQYLPVTGPAGPMPEPFPCGPTDPGMQQPVGPPLPGAPACLPQGPNELPSNGPSAFNTEGPPCPLCAFFANVGAMGLERGRFGHVNLAILDPQNLDTGNLPPLGSPVVLRLSDLDPDYTWGVRATAGYRVEDCAVEFTGFYLSNHTGRKQVDRQGQLDLPFFNPPLGFEGDNGLWLQADRVRLDLDDAMGDAEVNFRWAPNCFSGIEWILGVRYLDLRERLGIFTGDDDLTVVDAFGRPDPTRQATLALKTHNQILGPQLGLEGEWGLGECGCLSQVSVGVTLKGVWGVNFLGLERQLIRGDGLIGFATHRNETIFSHLYEVGVFVDWGINDHIRLRTGYDMMWLLHVADVQDQLDFNLANTFGAKKDNGNIFFQGPQIELQLLF
jgi:hypothetical protein